MNQFERTPVSVRMEKPNYNKTEADIRALDNAVLRRIKQAKKRSKQRFKYYEDSVS
jgi:hypothetical protein